MATTPFSATMITNLKEQTAWRFEGTIGEIFTPRFFCCTDPNTLGITGGKAPVAHIDLDPNPQFVGVNISYDGTGSYDPDGSIASYAWIFEGHTPGTSATSTGTLNYAVAGVYTIHLIVTDGTGEKSTPARIELVIQDAEDLGLYAGAPEGLSHGTTSSAISWTAKNTGLSGDDLVVNDVIIDPATINNPAANQTIWRATDGGVQVSNDGGATWAEKNPASVSNQWSDGVAPTVGDLTFVKLLFAGERLFLAATWQNASSEYRSWIFHTDDAAAMRLSTAGTVTWTEVTTNWEV